MHEATEDKKSSVLRAFIHLMGQRCKYKTNFMKNNFNYHWHLQNTKFKQDKGKVFSCFAGGGGSTMGYKLAGFQVIGFNEIDPKMANIYIKNHQPKYQFVEPIQDFLQRKDLPKEFYKLDILDGSPPCTPFSTAGKRHKFWGKEKHFREGQKKQVLDTLFFDFVEVAQKLQPKIVIAENVKGLLQGKAKIYTENILKSFENAGYQVNFHLLNSENMGVPQRRERVFFVAIRKDLAKKVQPLELNFSQEKIPFEKIKTDENDFSWTAHDQKIWENRILGDKCYADVLMRTENRYSNFSAQFIHNQQVVSTITATDGSKKVLFDTPRKMNSTELKLCQSFPLDYDFGTTTPSRIQYVLGMSVPPVMMANLVSEIYNQWREIFNN